MAKRAQLVRVITTDGVDISGHVMEVDLKIKPGLAAPAVTLTVYGRIDTDPETGQITVTVGD
jgi:hypothetical protein